MDAVSDVYASFKADGQTNSNHEAKRWGKNITNRLYSENVELCNQKQRLNQIMKLSKGYEHWVILHLYEGLGSDCKMQTTDWSWFSK